MFRVGQVVQKGKDHENMTPPTHAFNDVQGIDAQVLKEKGTHPR